MAFFNRLTMAGFGIAGAAFVFDQILFDVDGGEAAVIFDKVSGVQEKVLGEGMHFRIPFLQDPKIYNIKMDNRIFENPTQSRDLQNVVIGLRILYRPDIEKLPDIFKRLGESDKWADLVLRSITQEVLKSVIAMYDAEQLITMRELISAQVREQMVERGSLFNIIFDDVAIVELQFAREFNQAVEHKQVAQQEAERAKFLVDKAEQEKQARIIRAEGDSEAAELLGQAISEHGSGLIELRKIEAAREIAATMSKSRNVAYLPGGNNLLLNLNA
jgi:prohibitin 1